MDFEAYRKAHYVDPEPESRFGHGSIRGATLCFADYAAAVGFYTAVLGGPAYVEGAGTRGWKLGDTWLTLLAGGPGAPTGVEIAVVMESPAEAERLRDAFVAAGASGPPPSDQLMYEPIRACPVTDPFGTRIMIYARL